MTFIDSIQNNKRGNSSENLKYRILYYDRIREELRQNREWISIDESSFTLIKKGKLWQFDNRN